MSTQILLSLWSSTREAAQREGRSSELALELALRSSFYKVGTKQACEKRLAFGKGGLVKGAWSGFSHGQGGLLSPSGCLATISTPADKMVMLFGTVTPGRSYSSQTLINCTCRTVVSTCSGHPVLTWLPGHLIFSVPGPSPCTVSFLPKGNPFLPPLQLNLACVS